MTSFKAFRINQVDDKITADFTDMSIDDLTAGEVVVDVQWSGINYKDALAATGAGKILRQYPLNGGIDLAGTVASSADSRFNEGDEVLVCGCGLSESYDGGFAEKARVKGDFLVPMPAGLSAREAMGIGTAGFTAALAIVRMEQNGQRPDLGPIVVTGATGGVGSVAINMLSAIGYDVTAFTGKSSAQDYLRELGANDFIDRHKLEMSGRPLQRSQWGGAVDNAGGDILAWLASTINPWGNIASIGLVSSHKLNTTVMPFILRGVSLLGINSVEVPAELRAETWRRIGDDLKPTKLDSIISNEIDFAQLPTVFDDYLNGGRVGRTVVKIPKYNAL